MGVAEASGGDVGRVVQGQREIDALQRALGDHLLRPADCLLGRLEQQPHGAGELRRHLLEHGGDAQQGAGVDVVAAGVHLAVDGARIGQAGLLVDRQRVHVGTDRERGSGPPALDRADDTGARDARPVRDAEPRQLACHDARGADLLEGEFGMGVEVAADGDQIGLDAGDGFADRGLGIVGAHDGVLSGLRPLCGAMRGRGKAADQAAREWIGKSVGLARPFDEGYRRIITRAAAPLGQDHAIPLDRIAISSPGPRCSAARTGCGTVVCALLVSLLVIMRRQVRNFLPASKSDLSWTAPLPLAKNAAWMSPSGWLSP